MATRFSSASPARFDESVDRTGTTTGTDYPNLLIVDGSQTTDICEYAISVSGDVERAPEARTEDDLPWDERTVRIDASDVRGVLGKAIEAFRYSGSVTDVEVDGGVVIEIEGVGR